MMNTFKKIINRLVATLFVILASSSSSYAVGNPMRYVPPVIEDWYKTSFAEWKFRSAINDVRETLAKYGTKIREEVLDHRCSAVQAREIFTDVKDLRDHVAILKGLYEIYSANKSKMVRDYVVAEVEKYKTPQDKEWAQSRGDSYLYKIKEAEKLLKAAEPLERIALKFAEMPAPKVAEAPKCPEAGCDRDAWGQHWEEDRAYKAILEENEPISRGLEPLLETLHSGSHRWLRKLDQQEIANRQGLSQVGSSMYFQAKHALTWMVGFVGLSVPNFFAGPYDRRKAILVSICLTCFVVPLWSDYLAKKDEAERFDPAANYGFIDFLKTRYGTRHKLFKALKTEKKFWMLGAALAFVVMPQLKRGLLAVLTPERRENISDRLSSLWRYELDEDPFI